VVVNVTVAIVALAASVATMIQIYGIGDAGAQSVRGNGITHLKQANTK
jgi:tetrahydromethanopterin S-methyltransferase subunit D